MTDIPIAGVVVSIPGDAEQGDILFVTVPPATYNVDDAKDLMKLLNETHSDFKWVVVLAGATIDRIQTDVR